MRDGPRNTSAKDPALPRQRRDDFRVAATLPVLVSFTDRDITMRLHTVEISGGGLLLAGADMLKVDEQLQFALSINRHEKVTCENPPIVGTGTVIRIDGAGHRAICFDSIKDLDRRRLIRLVFELQRAARRKSLAGA